MGFVHLQGCNLRGIAFQAIGKISPGKEDYAIDPANNEENRSLSLIKRDRKEFSFGYLYPEIWRVRRCQIDKTRKSNDLGAFPIKSLTLDLAFVVQFLIFWMGLRNHHRS